MPSARIQWIDFCRVYTAFFVVLRHVDRPYGSFNYIIDLFSSNLTNHYINYLNIFTFRDNNYCNALIQVISTWH